MPAKISQSDHSRKPITLTSAANSRPAPSKLPKMIRNADTMPNHPNHGLKRKDFNITIPIKPTQRPVKMKPKCSPIEKPA